MTQLDRELIHRKVKFIQKDLDKLEKFRRITLAEFEENYENQLIVERLLEKIIGRLIDCNYHILKTNFNNIPQDYFDSFICMGRHKVIETNLANTVAQSAGLRNILAHEYDAIDPAKVHDSISLALNQIPEYLHQLLGQL